MVVKKLVATVICLAVLVTVRQAFAQEAPDVGPCTPGASYDAACDANQDGVISVVDIQLTAGHFNQSGTFIGDNNHTHLGQTWTGNNNPLTINGSFGATGWAPLVLSNSAVGGDGLHVQSAGGDGIQVTSATYAGVYVEASDGVGFQVNQAGTYGVSTSSTAYDGVRVRLAGENGVSAESTSAAHYGGLFYNTTSGGVGLYARSGDLLTDDLILGGNNASSDDGRLASQPNLVGSDLVLTSNDEAWVILDNNDDEAGNFIIYNGAGTAIFTVNESGTMTASGTKSAVVNTEQHGERLLYAMESPQNWFEDFGSAQLASGEVTVLIEPIYAETVNLGEPYHVFLTPLGDCPLYVAEKTSMSFTVRAMDSQACGISFDYRIVALRKGYETLRLEPLVDVKD